ncbi:MAG: hypothetical protein A3B95_03885 [Candidatus Doudnabacteria bacterium RIFCSPHIGHO2_02_FULL_43_13b]|nr:MAG: hypothetical protein A3B95_03885 [Candidatus Doudnabacteria bacterium RIFCSPHIGHO2_02_FULL_43_13b]
MKKLGLAIITLILLGGAAMLGQAIPQEPRIRPDVVALLNDPATLVSAKDVKARIETDGWPEIVAKIGWVLRHAQLPATARSRSIATANSNRKNWYPIVGDIAPAKRVLSYMIIYLDKQYKLDAAAAAAQNERITMLEQQIKELEAAVAELKKRVK